MKRLIDNLGISVDHLKCLEETFLKHHSEYSRIETILNSDDFSTFYEDISRELYAGGKKPRGSVTMARQMILGDIIEYIFTGRAFYYATKSDENFSKFLKLILYSINKILIFDIITVNPNIRKSYIELLEEKIDTNILYEKDDDKEIAATLKDSDVVIFTDEWTTPIDLFVDSILPKTLGCPKELVVFAELIRLKKGIVIPLLLIQRLFGDRNPIAPPDFFLIKGNKEMYGIEVGYAKEGQSREFSIRTSIPTFAIDLKNNMHNRCPKCGENILYCDMVIEAYSNNTLDTEINNRGGKFYCRKCENFNEGQCEFSNYYGWVNGTAFHGGALEGKKGRHYHAKCVRNDAYTYRNTEVNILNERVDDFFAQVPELEGLENL